MSVLIILVNKNNFGDQIGLKYIWSEKAEFS